MSERFTISEPYAPRPIGFLGVHEHTGWRIKLYSITYGESALDRARFDDGFALALNYLPQPAVTQHRPGIGFAIFHQGRGWDYLVLNWWDNENELIQRIWVRERDKPDATWRRASESQSICVWDLQVIWFERESYVKHMLMSRECLDVDGYLHESISKQNV